MVAVYTNQLAARLKPLPPLVLLWGEDAGAIRQSAQQVIAATAIDPADPFATDKLTLADLASEPTRLMESAQTMSFTSPHRLIWLQGVSGEETTAQLAVLTQAVKDTLSLNLQGVTIVLPLPRVLEKTSAIVKAVEAHPQALSVRFFADSGRDIAQFLQTELKAAGKAITPPALQLLADGLGADRDIARREVEKLALYVGQVAEITEDDVLASLSGAIAADAFRLAEAVGSRNPAQTDRLLQHLLQQGEDLNSAFSLTLNHLQALKTAQTLQKQGNTEDDILKATGKFRAPPQARQAFLAQAQRYPAARLASLADYALDALTQSRSGTLDANLVLSRALLALSA
jgi:DNA polymerase-3 subunit delta